MGMWISVRRTVSLTLKTCASEGFVAAGQFAAGAAQFRADVAVNPNDTEEAIWAYLCEAQMSSAADARTNFLKARSVPHPTPTHPKIRADSHQFHILRTPADFLGVESGHSAMHVAR